MLGSGASIIFLVKYQANAKQKFSINREQDNEMTDYYHANVKPTSNE